MPRIFFAYPAQPVEIGNTIERARELLLAETGDAVVETWRRGDAAGVPLTAPILDSIERGDIVAGDITRPNFNVTYELAYGYGKGKRVLPVWNRSIQADENFHANTGIFDTILYEPYSNHETLAAVLKSATSGRRLATDFPYDPQPIYTVLPAIKPDEILAVLGRAKKAGLRVRSFDGAEEARLSAVDAVRAVSASHGIVVHLLPPSAAGAVIHNTRVAFVVGLAHALARPTLLLQHGHWDTPLDVRDAVETYESDAHFNGLFRDFAERVFDSLYASPPAPGSERPRNILANLNLGHPAAEDEQVELSSYFLEREEYRQVLDGRANIVVGRKGSGKTAVWVRVRDKLRENRARVVIDLNPEAAQLRRLKDVVLRCLNSGSKEFLLAAFWEYVLLLEICYKLLEKDRDVHKRNHTLFEPYQRLLKYVSAEPSTASSFAERLVKLIDRIGDVFRLHRRLSS